MLLTNLYRKAVTHQLKMAIRWYEADDSIFDFACSHASMEFNILDLVAIIMCTNFKPNTIDKRERERERERIEMDG